MTETTAPRAPTSTPAAADWRLAIPEHRRRHLRAWLWSVAAATFAVMVVGGITRLTQSGLSIVDWQPLMGVIPPLSEAQWLAAFDRYREFPEYQQLRRGMTLAEFQFIFFWEYLHRLVARLIGVVFLVPFVVFAVRGYLTRPLALRALALFALGAAQGVLGWVMVQSGLVEQPSVSHYRLAAHLGLAFVIFGACVWLARELTVSRSPSSAAASAASSAASSAAATATPVRRLVRRGLAVLGALVALQVVWGAFVAGLKAGFFYNTFPLMGGALVPPNLLLHEPAIVNFFQNPVAVQWTHRVLGTVLGVAALFFFLRVRRAAVDAATRRLNAGFFGLILAQYALGVATLVYRVPVTLGVAHQALALVLFGVWVWWMHHERETGRGVAAAPTEPALAGQMPGPPLTGLKSPR
jgi:heme a synthase